MIEFGSIDLVKDNEIILLGLATILKPINSIMNAKTRLPNVTE